MTDDQRNGAAIIAAHQELVSRVEGSARRMRVMAAVTLVVSSFLALSYLSQLLLLASGTNTITVHLDDPGLVAVQLAVLGLVLAWLYVGAADFRYSGRVRREIRAAREKERAIEERISG